MKTAAHPRSLFTPRTFGTISVTLTSSASLWTGVVKTFRWASQIKMQNDWTPETKPPSGTCPERFCFHWAEAGDKVTGVGRQYDTVTDAINDAALVSTARCACSFGPCVRDTSSDSITDWYEANEPALEKAGLPWFYFVPSIKCLGEQFHARYVEESAELWGDHDGLK